MVRISDFRLARAVSGASQVTQSGAVIGAPHYMSPEQGQRPPVGIRSDVYSLGVTLFEMLTGKGPYESETPVSVILKHLLTGFWVFDGRGKRRTLDEKAQFRTKVRVGYDDDALYVAYVCHEKDLGALVAG